KMLIDIAACSKRLAEHDNILLLCHRDPDGDTVGSAMAIFDTLTAMGKKVRMECVSLLPANLQFMQREFPAFKEEYVVAIDVAAEKMLGDGDIRKRHVDLTIDHHPFNSLFATETCLFPFPAAGELVYDVLKGLGVTISPFAATCLLTAVSSDTGS
ncbi:MAG: DHH family phosphoesterase, partial [Oscillospiraceae bacterium]